MKKGIFIDKDRIRQWNELVYEIDTFSLRFILFVSKEKGNILN